jgi:hypothetical protein
MSNIIQIKRSTSQSAPASLANGELAFSFLNTANSLFIGDPIAVTPGTPLRIAGGKYSFIHQANTDSGSGGVLTANAVVVTNANNFLDQFKTNTIVIGPDGTTNAAATLVVSGTANISGNATVGGTLTVSGNLSFNGITTFGSGNVVYDTDTLFVDAFNNRVGILTTAPDASLQVVGTANVSGNTALGGKLTVTGNATFSNTITVTGNATFSNTIAVTGNATFSNLATFNANVNFDSGVLFVDTVNNRIGINDTTPGVALDITGDANVTANLVANNVTINNDLTVSGNVNINGTLTTIDTVNLVVEDPMFKLAKNNNVANSAGDAIDAGFYSVYANNTTDFYTGIFRDASDGKYKIFTGLEAEPSTTVDTAALSYKLATLNAFFEVGGFVANATNFSITANSTYAVALAANTLSLATALPVGSGGTGTTTHTQNGVLYGNGSAALQTTAAGANGQVLQVISNVPAFAGIDGGSF